MCLACQKKRSKAYRRTRHVEANYGLTPAEYEALADRQSGVCDMCHELRALGYHWHVDHDHAVERELGARASVRGLICARCNKMLRLARDKPSVFLGGFDYLTAWPSARVFAFVKGNTE